MDRARRAVEAIRRRLVDVERQLATHPYLAAIESGELPREKLGVFGREQMHIIRSDMQSFAIRVSKAERPQDLAFFSASMEFEGTALKALEPILNHFPAPAEEGPLPGAFAYAAFVAWMADRVRDAEYVGAFLVNLPVWGATCDRLARALRGRYELDDVHCAFFDLFATPSPAFEEDALDIISSGLERGVKEASIFRSSRLLQGYERMYWDALAADAGLGGA
jgi:hypothetical protein